MTTLLDRLIALYPSAKRQTFKEMLQADRIRIDGKQAIALKQPLADDALVKVLPKHDARAVAVAADPLPFEIIFEDRDVLVIDKPAGLLTSTTPREKRPTAWAAVQQYIITKDRRAKPGLIHRLDRDASGLLIFSKNDNAYRSLKTQFFHHTITRVYVAVVHGRMNPPLGRIESNLNERADGTVFSQRSPVNAQRAISDYQTAMGNKKFSLVRIALLTGRKHQIRVHLSERGHPIVGDPTYGSSSDPPLMLRAIELEFDHPTTRRRETFKLEIPEPMQAMAADVPSRSASRRG